MPLVKYRTLNWWEARHPLFFDGAFPWVVVFFSTCSACNVFATLRPLKPPSLPPSPPGFLPLPSSPRPRSLGRWWGGAGVCSVVNGGRDYGIEWRTRLHGKFWLTVVGRICTGFGYDLFTNTGATNQVPVSASGDR
jgi:hypothetical protein